MKASKAPWACPFSEVKFCGTFTFNFFFFPTCSRFGAHILFQLWYWTIMNAHTKKQQNKMFETEFIDSQKSDPPFAHLLALSHIYWMSKNRQLAELLHMILMIPQKRSAGFALNTYPHLEPIYPWLLPILVTLIVNTAVDCYCYGQAIVQNAVIPTYFCTMFWQRIGGYSEHFESESFTMFVTQSHQL